jgi:lipopolysaccharide biosynthesis protein
VNKVTTIAVLYHIFYEDSSDTICHELKALNNYKTVFLFNICLDTPDKSSISKTLKECFPGCIIITASNKGKDIGAKLALLQLVLYLQIDADYLLLLHDKKSLQALKSATWKKGLLKILSPDKILQTLKIFQENTECGIIATEEYVIKEFFENGLFPGINGGILTALMTKYKIKPPSYSFVAGTMFWVKAKPMKDFFRQHSPLDIRKELEDGNVLDNFSGTITHSWERLFSWVVTSQHYSIKGI